MEVTTHKMHSKMDKTQEMKYVIGHKVELERTFTDKDVREFAILTGDTNLIHLDDEYAATTPFKRRLVHGMSVASLFSTIFGTIYPGLGTIYMQQSLKFTHPVFINDKINAIITLDKLHETKPIGFFKTVCLNQDGVTVIEGEAVLKLP